MKLTPQNFFTHFFLLDHKNADLDRDDRNTTLVCSVALGILTLGTVHATCAVIKWCITQTHTSSDVAKSIDSAGREAISQTKTMQKSTRSKLENREPEKGTQEKKVELQKTVKSDKSELAKMTPEEIEETSKHLTGENFAACMHLAFEHNVPNAIWRGLAFAAEHPEDPSLKEFTSRLSPSHWFRSDLEKQVVNLIELGQKCHINQIVPSLSPRNQRAFRLECKGVYGETKQTKQLEEIISCLQKAQAMAPVEEFDTGNYELTKGFKDSNDYISFIRKMALTLPHLKEIKITFGNTFELGWKEDEESTGVISFLIKNFREIEGIGIHFPYGKEETNQYLEAFKNKALLSQTGNPIQLRSLNINSKELTNHEIQELSEQFPSLHHLEISRVPITVFPKFPLLERVRISQCEQLTEISVPASHLIVSYCNQVETINAPEAKEIRCLGNRKLTLLNADKAERVLLDENGLTEVTLPSAKEFLLKDKSDTRTGGAGRGWKKIVVPEDCEVPQSQNLDPGTLIRIPTIKLEKRELEQKTPQKETQEKKELQKKVELQKTGQKDKDTLPKITPKEIEKTSKHLTGENFAACMHLAFEQNVPNAIWRGLAFAAEHPEDPSLTKLVSKGKGWFSSEKDKQIGRLIEAGRECCKNKIVPSMSPRDQRSIRLECESFKFGILGPKSLPYIKDPEGKTSLVPEGKISQDTIWSCLQKVQSIAPVEELDTGNYELNRDEGTYRISYNNDYIKFINQASSILPTLKEIKISFGNSINFEWKENRESTGLLSFLVRSFREIEGIGIRFDYKQEQTDKYLDAFIDNALVSQTGKPIQLRSLVMDFNELPDVSMQDILELFPGLHDLEVSHSQTTVFPESPHLERLKIVDCPQLTELNVSKVRHLTVLSCDQLKEIEAPEARRVEIQEATPGTFEKITIPEECAMVKQPPAGCQLIRIPKENQTEGHALEEKGNKQAVKEPLTQTEAIAAQNKEKLKLAREKLGESIEKVEKEIEVLSEQVTGEDFVFCMRFAFENNVPNAIWRGLAFAAEHPEDPSLKEFTSLLSPSHWFRSDVDKQIVNLIELGQKCHANQIVPSISPRNQRAFRLECESEFEGTKQLENILSCLKKAQAMAPVKEFDTGSYELRDGRYDRSKQANDYVPFITTMAPILPNLKEIKISFGNKVQFDWEKELTAPLPLLIRNFKEIEGIGVDFPYDKEKTDQYLEAFKHEALLSEAKKPIQLRSLNMSSKELADDEMQELSKQFPSLHHLEINGAPITVLPDFPLLERVRISACSQLTEISVPTVSHLTVSSCANVQKVNAPEAIEIQCLGNMKLTELSADKAEWVHLNENALTEVTLPSARELLFKDKDDERTAPGTRLEKIVIPEECQIFKAPTKITEANFVRIPKEIPSDSKGST